MGWPLRPRPGARLRPEHARQKLRLWGHPVRMSCKNFLTTHQLDTHFWTEFLYTFSWQYDPSRRVCRKRAITIHVEPVCCGYAAFPAGRELPHPTSLLSD